MADKEEFTLDSYAKKSKTEENKGTKGNKKFGGKNRIEKKVNGVKKARSAIRRTGNNNANRSGGKPRQNLNNRQNSNAGQNRQRNNSRPQQEAREIVKPKTARPIPEHKKRIVKVYNLVPTINNEEFYNLFVKYGSIEQSKIETDKKGKSEEKGYVVYRDNQAAVRAIEDLNGVELEGRIITVEFMKDGEKLDKTASSGKTESGERDRERRNSDAPGVQKRIFKTKEDRFVRNRDDNNHRGNRRDNDRGDRRGNSQNQGNRFRSNNGNRNNNRNRSNNGNRNNGNRNNRKFNR